MGDSQDGSVRSNSFIYQNLGQEYERRILSNEIDRVSSSPPRNQSPSRQRRASLNSINNIIRANRSYPVADDDPVMRDSSRQRRANNNPRKSPSVMLKQALSDIYRIARQMVQVQPDIVEHDMYKRDRSRQINRRAPTPEARSRSQSPSSKRRFNQISPEEREAYNQRLENID